MSDASLLDALGSSTEILVLETRESSRGEALRSLVSVVHVGDVQRGATVALCSCEGSAEAARGGRKLRDRSPDT